MALGVRLSRPLLSVLALAAAHAQAENVLASRAPVSGGSTLLTDGQTLIDGADWQARGVTFLQASEAVVWDLGAVRVLDAAALQGDNNDDYFLEVSLDGDTWRGWWHGGPRPHPGLATRDEAAPEVQARFVRLLASGGDGRYSVSEVEVFSGSTWGTRWTSSLLRPRWFPHHPLDVAWAWVVVGAALLLLVTSRGSSPRLVVALSAAAGVGVLAVAWDALGAPPEAARVDFLRGVAALLGALAVARELSPWPRAPAHPGVVLGVLGVAATLGLSCFLNLFQPQFHDVGRGAPTFLHHYDMRTYYPIAKYFPELRFDGVYAASTVVVAEDRGGLDAMAHQPLRDLRTHQVTTVGEARRHLEEVRARFAPERWASFVEDMGYFRRAMGDGGFLGSMSDHGGNATPVWFLAARLLFAGAPASDTVLWLGVLVDAALVLLAFFALFRAWGARTALVAMTVFGAMDFYQFGSNWFGAALRHDWLALWGLGLWALKRERHVLGGALLAYSALIRAFPAVALVMLVVPVAWSLVERLRAGRFDARAFLDEHRPFLRAVLGAAAATTVLVGLSVAVFGAASWVEWLRKVGLLDQDNHVNNLSVRTWVTTSRAGWLSVVAGSVVVLGLLGRRARPEVAAAWGVALIPVIFNPANYYLHAAFLLPVLAEEARGHDVSGRGRVSWLLLLGMCAASYFTSFSADIGEHFRQDTTVLLTTLAALAGLHLAWRSTPSPRALPLAAPSGPPDTTRGSGASSD